MDIISSRTTLENLIATLAYHKQRRERIPMPPAEAEQTARIIRELNATLKTIIRL